jgi:ABC-type nitrate/sulfonate/bicarbonate transport system ATPase subunit
MNPILRIRGVERRFDTTLALQATDRGMVFQSYTLFPWLNVLDKVCFGLGERGLPPAQQLELAQGFTVLFVTPDIDEAVFMGSRVVVMSARPGRIKLQREIELPHPRHCSVKTTPAFAALKAELTEAVRAEVIAAQALMA